MKNKDLFTFKQGLKKAKKAKKLKRVKNKILLLLTIVFCISFCDNSTLNSKKIKIGDWDMVTQTIKNVKHDLDEDFINIRHISVLIKDDSATSIKPLTVYNFLEGTMEGGILGIDKTFISLARILGGTYDNPAFDSTNYNRGWIIIEYIQ